jgi:hypothetical protein
MKLEHLIYNLGLLGTMMDSPEIPFDDTWMDKLADRESLFFVAVNTDLKHHVIHAALRGKAWLFRHIQHTAGIYCFFASVAGTARKQAGYELCWWETGAMCERRYRVGEHWYNLRPDALAELRFGQQQFRFWLEWDRGTMNVRDLSIKFASYAHFIASREWVREDVRLPRLLCVAPDIAQEKRMQRVMQNRLAHTSGLVVWTTTEVLLNEYGPLAPIWVSGIQRDDQAGLPGSVHRYGLYQLVPVPSQEICGPAVSCPHHSLQQAKREVLQHFTPKTGPMTGLRIIPVKTALRP